MPRDGSGIYTKPYPNVVSGTTIESAVHNGTVSDIETDLNAARPIIAGGTGASNATQARDNLDAERAMQQVTNFDTHVFEAGSFWSDIGATSAPVGGEQFTGICTFLSASNFIFLKAFSWQSGKTYSRKKDGTWAAWKADEADYVNITGDTMTGALTVNAAIFSAETSASGTYQFGTSGIKYLKYDGSKFLFNGATLTVNEAILSAVTTSTGTYHFGTSGLKFINYDGTNFNCSGGGLNTIGFIRSATTSSIGTLYYGSSTTKYLDFDGTNFNLVGGSIYLGEGFRGRQGTGGAVDANVHNFYYTGNMFAFVNNSNIGIITITSDYRIKTDVKDLPGMWSVVKALHPISYVRTDWTPAWELEARTKEAAARGETMTPFMAGDGLERWGFIAHELQATLIPTAATGYKDAEGIIQSPDVMTVIATLTKALQEAMMRIEALEVASSP